MRRIITAIVITLGVITSARAQQYSPYVENKRLIVNNSGFKPAALRTTKLSTPTPMHTQADPVNGTISPRFQVAKVDLILPANWALANGWLLGANSALSNILAAVVPTGCAAYFESNAPVGSWRVPTLRELYVINLVKLELESQEDTDFTQLGINHTYWSATQANATQAWALGINAVEMSAKDKITPNRVRCIRDR